MAALDGVNNRRAPPKSGVGRWLPGREQLFTGVMLVCVANAVAVMVKESVAAGDILNAAMAGFGVSWAFWVALVLAARLGLKAEAAPASRADLGVAAVGLLLAAWPVVGLASLAATLMSVWILWDRRSDPKLRAMALILIAMAVNLLWARLMMLVFARPIEAFDAFWVGLIGGVPVHGNVVGMEGGGDHVAIMAACTSVANGSLALLLWLAVTRSFRPVPARSELVIGAALFLTVMVINIGRLWLEIQNRAQLHFWHGPSGASVIVALITAAALGWAFFGVRREAFP